MYCQNLAKSMDLRRKIVQNLLQKNIPDNFSNNYSSILHKLLHVTYFPSDINNS